LFAYRRGFNLLSAFDLVPFEIASPWSPCFPSYNGHAVLKDFYWTIHQQEFEPCSDALETRTNTTEVCMALHERSVDSGFLPIYSVI